ncbi:hypothetical protein P9112_000359 [Eukaryota sp. TZLM1-RC]
MFYILRYLYIFIKYLLFGKRQPLDSVFRFNSRCTLNDIDYNFHMNNASYLVVFELARWSLVLESGLLTVCRRGKFNPVVAGIAVTYKRQLKLFQKYHIETKITGISGHWGFLEQTMYSGGKMMCRASLKLVFLKGRSKVPLEKLFDNQDGEWVEGLEELGDVHSSHLNIEKLLRMES